MDTQEPGVVSDAGGQRPFPRLVWSNPGPPARPQPDAPRRPRVDRAVAVERQLAGADGLSREQFLALYSGRRRTPLALAPLPSN